MDSKPPVNQRVPGSSPGGGAKAAERWLLA